MNFHDCADDYLDELTNEEDDLHKKYEHIDLPTTAVGRYELFKNYYGEFYFCHAKIDYRRKAIRGNGIPGENDINNITDEIRKLELIINHPSLSRQVDRAKLLEAAQLHFINGTLGTIKDKEKLYLHIFLLHEENWFNDFRLPDEAFNFHQFDDDNFYRVAEVYGRYVRLYEYLKDKRKTAELNAVKKAVSRSDKDTSQEKDKRTITIFKDLFIDEGKYKEVMQLLSSELPDYLLNKYPELRRLEGPFITSEKDGRFSINKMLPTRASYLSGLLIACKKKEWLHDAIYDTYRIILNRTFDIVIKSPAAIKKATYGDLDDKYIGPFEKLLAEIK